MSFFRILKLDAEPVAEPVAESVAEPDVEPVAELVVEPVAESVVELDAESDAESQTSTIEFSHTPFEAFQHQVLALVKQTVWVDSATAEITVERLAGGGYNRIIGITRQDQDKTNTTTSYILRVPRFHSAQVENDVAALLLVQRYSEIPAPRVVTFDNSAKNQLGSPYMIQTRLAGASLHLLMSDLSQEQRCQLARELGSVFRQILSIRSSKAGKLVLPSNNKALDAPLHIAPWIQNDVPISIAYNNSSQSETVYSWLINTLRAQRAKEVKLRPNNTFKHERITCFMNMPTQPEKAGRLNDCPYSLAHLDLAPRNIMIHAAFGPKQPIISGILDWDSAVLGPIFMSCAPPTWL